ncbi:hypothetical protein [Melittangium boletus]
MMSSASRWLSPSSEKGPEGSRARLASMTSADSAAAPLAVSPRG